MTDSFLDYITLGMGNNKSKIKDRFGRTKKEATYAATGGKRCDGPREREFSAEIHDRFAEDEELRILRQTIQQKPELFILNNLMMSVQFFENYDEEIGNIRDSLISSREAELNDRLRPLKHAVIPDVLQQHVARRVDFTYIDPIICKLTIELLHPIRIYVAFDNIEVTELPTAPPYCTLNETVSYSMQLKPSPNHKGYVLLRRLEVNPPKKAVSTDDLELASMSSVTRDEIYSEGESLYGGKSSARVAGVLPRLGKGLRESSRNDDEGIGEVRNYGSQGNLSEYSTGHQSKHEVIYGVRGSKASDAQRGLPKTSNRQYGKSRLVRSANGSPAGSTSSGYKSGNCNYDSDSDYSYAGTTYTTSKMSDSSLDSGSVISSTEIPPRCFRKIVYTPDGEIYDARREKRPQKMNSRQQMIRQAIRVRNCEVWYLNSTKFMKHFCRLFNEQLAVPMGFEPDRIYDESVQGGVICRTKSEGLEGTTSTKLEEFEIVPSVKSWQWPNCAQEWLDRPRATWPSYSVIEEVRKFGCHMIPDGMQPNRPDRYKDLEWQLVFPGAERYLETCLTYSQVRVYLIALMLQKTFIRPVDSIFGLTVAHIKNRLFWMIEEDDRPSMWMENRMGESLMKLLKSLYDYIKQDTPNLPDYFVRDKNLFQERSHLLRTQKQLGRILENPVMYVFHAMENIRHSRQFFPRLDFEELFRILTADTLTLANPALASQLHRPIARSNRENDSDQIRGIWEKGNQDNSEKERIYARKPVRKKNLINPRQASDQVVEIQVRCERMEPRRMSCLLDFFIRHFIKMAESCHNYRALPQKIVYVDQAERLSVMLMQHPTHKDVAKTYLEKLYALKRKVPRSKSQNTKAKTPSPEPPETPRRNPDRAIFARPLLKRYESPENLEDRQRFVEIPQPGETKEYDLESVRSSVYNLQAPPSGSRTNRSVVTVTIHEEEAESVELRNSSNSAAANDGETTNSDEKPRIVSIADTHDESFLTETTYI